MIHFIRPWFFLLLLPLCYLLYCAVKLKPTSRAWAAVCDPHLLQALFQHQGKSQKKAWFSLLFSLFFMILAGSGPAWQRLPTPLFQQHQPKLILLDTSKNMLAADLQPDRFQRALFVAEDLLHLPEITPIGFIAYTSEPFVVSPLTDDATTITSLLTTLNTDTPPVSGQNLALALKEAAALIRQAKFNTGAMLVMTGSAPDKAAIQEAATLHGQGFTLSILPILQGTPAPNDFQAFAQAGGGFQLTLASPQRWLTTLQQNQHALKRLKASFPRWKDEGRWFILPALFFLLPVFQRGWVRRIEI